MSRQPAAPGGRLRWGAFGCAVLLAAALTGCREGYLPYYDPAPEAWRVSYDDRHAERIETRRELLDQIAVNPRDYGAIRRLAAGEWSSGRQAEALQVLDYLLRQINGEDLESPTAPEGRLALLEKVRYLALMAYDAERFAIARRILERFAVGDRNAEYFYLAGMLADRASQPQVNADPVARAAEHRAARSSLDAALQAEPRHVDALQLRARLAFNDGDWDRVLELCQRWSEILPADGRAWYTQGVALQRQKRYEEAVPMFEMAAKVEPEQPDPWYGLAIAHMAGGDRPSADRALREVIRLKPTHAQAYFKLFLLYSEQPLSEARFDALVRAATLARRDPTIQQALVDAVRAERAQRTDLLLFGLQNLMNLELENGRRLRLAPILAYVDEAIRQERYEEAYFALADPLLRNPVFDAPRPEIGLRLLRLAVRWVDVETGHWNPPAVTLLDPAKPLGAENIGRPVLYKSILDRALHTGRIMFTSADWTDYQWQAVPVERGNTTPADAPVLAEQLPPAEREELLLLYARINVARCEHLRRILMWHQALSPIVPYSLKMTLANNPGEPPLPAYPTPTWPAWWLQAGWDPFRRVQVSPLVPLDDNVFSRAVLSLSALGPILNDELRVGLSRDNYGDTVGALDERQQGDMELQSALGDGRFTLDLLTRMSDPVLRGDTPENRDRRRDWIYLQIQLAPLWPTAPLRGDARGQRILSTLNEVGGELPALLAADLAPRRQEALRRLQWYWLMRQGDHVTLARALAATPVGMAEDGYAAAARLWLRAAQQNRGFGGAVAAPQMQAGDLRTDLERLLGALSTYETVPALRLRMQIGTAVGLAFGDDELAAAAAESLVRIESTTENGQETQVLNLLAMIYEKQERWLPAIYCLRRSVARTDATRQIQAERKRGLPAGEFNTAEDLRILRWRLLNLWRKLAANEPARDALVEELLLTIAGYGADGLPVEDGVAEKSPARAAALYDLASRRMARGALKDGYRLFFEAYNCFESPSDSIEHYRLSYCLIALAADPVGNIQAVRESILRDQIQGAAFKADNARVLQAFDAALRGQSTVLLETPQMAAAYLRPAQEALELALAIRAAQVGAAQDCREHLKKAAAGKCIAIAAMAPAIGILCDGLLARQQGDAAALASARQAWADQGGLPDYLKDLSAPELTPAPEPAVPPAPPAPATP